MKRIHTRSGVGAALCALTLTVAGCGSGAGNEAGGDDKTITMAVVSGWTDQTGTAHLYKALLEQAGYEVDIKELSDNAPIFAALAGGDIDVMSSAWPERTHKSYMERFGQDIEDLGTYYDDASLFLAVPDYSDMKSIGDIESHAADLDDKIIGIEPGAGLTKVTQEDAMPAYGLDKNFQLVTSSTTAMLTELKEATDSEQDIVVTLWKPFWANQEFPVRPLEDPDGAMGASEGLHSLGREGFAEDYPEVAEMMADFKLTDEQYGTLENMMVNDFETGQEDEAVAQWLKDNPDFAPPLVETLEG